MNIQEPKTKKPIIPASKMNPRAVAAALPACSLYPLHGSLMLLDAHLVFQPLLAALGVSPHQVPQGTRAHWPAHWPRPSLIIGDILCIHIVPPGESKGKGYLSGQGAGEGGGESAPALESLGSKLSLLAWLDVFRIDIVVSDLAARDRRHANNKGKGNVTL